MDFVIDTLGGSAVAIAVFLLTHLAAILRGHPTLFSPAANTGMVLLGAVMFGLGLALLFAEAQS